MIGEKIMPDIILVSGGFDPIHSGHIKLINEANKYGDVVVLLNSDQWLRNKKGKEFLSFDEGQHIRWCHNDHMNYHDLPYVCFQVYEISRHNEQDL